MRKLIFILSLILICFGARAQIAGTANVVYNLQNFSSQGYSVMQIKLTPLAVVGTNSTNILLPTKFTGVTGLNGQVTFTNVVVGYSYQVALYSIQDPVHPIGVFTNYFQPGTTGTVNAANYLGYTNAAAFGFFFPTNTYTNLIPSTNITFTTDSFGDLSISSTGGGGSASGTNTFQRFTNSGQIASGSDAYVGGNLTVASNVTAYYVLVSNTTVNLPSALAIRGPVTGDAVFFNASNGANGNNAIISDHVSDSNWLGIFVAPNGGSTLPQVTIAPTNTTFYTGVTLGSNQTITGSGAGLSSLSTIALTNWINPTMTFVQISNILVAGNSVVEFAAGLYPNMTNFFLGDNLWIKGNGAHLQMSTNGSTGGFLIQMQDGCTNCHVSGLILDGQIYNAPGYTLPGSMTYPYGTPDKYTTSAGTGAAPTLARSGFRLITTTNWGNNTCDNCFAYGFNVAGYYLTGLNNQGTQHPGQLRLMHCASVSNYIGFYVPDACLNWFDANNNYTYYYGSNYSAEYSSIEDCMDTSSSYSIVCDSANMSVVNFKGTGAAIGTSSTITGPNQFHSCFNGWTLNHCSKFAIQYTSGSCSFSAGVQFNGCQFRGDTAMWFTEAQGINFSGCTFESGMTIYATNLCGIINLDPSDTFVAAPTINSDGTGLITNYTIFAQTNQSGQINITGNLGGNGTNITSLNAASLSIGTAPTARLGSGSATSSTYLRGDSSWVSDAGLQTPWGQIINAAQYNLTNMGQIIFPDGGYVRVQSDVMQLSGVGGVQINGQGAGVSINDTLQNIDVSGLPGNGTILWTNNTAAGIIITNPATATAITIPTNTAALTGNGGGLTNLNANNLASGTVPFATFPQTGIGTNGNVLTTSGSAATWVAPSTGSGTVTNMAPDAAGVISSVAGHGTAVLTPTFNNAINTLSSNNAIALTNYQSSGHSFWGAGAAFSSGTTFIGPNGPYSTGLGVEAQAAQYFPGVHTLQNFWMTNSVALSPGTNIVWTLDTNGVSTGFTLTNSSTVNFTNNSTVSFTLTNCFVSWKMQVTITTGTSFYPRVGFDY